MSETVKIAAAQLSAEAPESRDAFLARLEHHVAEAAKAGCELVLFPEYFTLPLLALGPDRPPREGIVNAATEHSPAIVESLKRLAQENGIIVIGGSLPFQSDGEVRTRRRSLFPMVRLSVSR